MTEPTFEIAGGTVTFRTRFPAREFHDLPAIMAKVAPQGVPDIIEVTKFLSKIVESWTLPGDPHSADTYMDMDVIDVMVLVNRGLETFQQRLTALQAVPKE